MTPRDDAESGATHASKTCPECGARYDADAIFCPRDGSALATAGLTDLLGHVVAGRYRVIEQLGEGAMGRVYLAEHIKMRRRCALKMMSPELVTDADAISRFNREAQNASRIQHPNVAAVYDFGASSDGLAFLAMELVSGESLSSIRERERVLPAERAAAIARQVADGLEAAHDLGIVHRDLKPDNIMIARAKDGRDVVKIVDFGIAKATHQGAGTGAHLTRTGMVVGTLQYMSPEQLGGDPVDGRSDLYALACILYEMLTGESSFAGATIETRLQRRLTGPPLRPRDANATVPAWLDALVVKALAREPSDRFQTAGELRAALVPGAPDPITAPPSWKSRRLWFSAGALAGTATLVALGMTWHRSETNPDQSAAAQSAAAQSAAAQPAAAQAPVSGLPAATDTTPRAAVASDMRAHPAPGPAPAQTPAAPPRVPREPRSVGGDSLAASTQLDLLAVQRTALAARQLAVDGGAAAPRVRQGDQLMQAADSAIAGGRYPVALRKMLDAQETWRAAADSATAARAALRAAPGPAQAASSTAAGLSQRPPPRTVAPAPAPDPTPGIQAAIDDYAHALASRDIDRVRVAYPALTADEARRWQDIFDATNAITATLTLVGPPHVSPAGSADVDVTAAFEFDYKRGVDGDRHPTLTYHAVLVRDGQRWKLASIK